MEPAQKKQRTEAAQGAGVARGPKADELNTIMTAWLVDQHHEHVDKHAALLDVYSKVEARASRLSRRVQRADLEIDNLHTRLHQEMVDGQRLLTVALEMLEGIPEAQRAAWGRRIGEAIGGDIVHLVADEQLSETESE